MSGMVYLAGPIAGQSYEAATEWRERMQDALSRYDIWAYSPMRFKEYLADQAEMPHVFRHVLSTQRGIVARDLGDVRRADVIFAHLAEAEHVSIGTVWELGAAKALGKQVVATVGAAHDHPMVRETIDFLVQTPEEATQVIIAILMTGVEA